MKTILISIFTICCLILSTLSMASEKKYSFYPKGCNPKMVGYQGDNLVLGTQSSSRLYRVYVLYNATYQPILMSHLTGGHILDLPMPSVIQPGNWSAILVDENNFTMNCQDHSGSGYGISCVNAIMGCELAVSEVMLSSQGEYWITENNDNHSSLFSSIRGEGIYP